VRTYRTVQHGLAQILGCGRCQQRAVQACVHGVKGEWVIHPPSAKTWGFSDVCFAAIAQTRAPISSYVMENSCSKFLPAEFHAQTAVEAAFQLHPELKAV